MSIEYTKEELEEFDAIITMTESTNQVARISARMKLNSFIQDHGKEKCDAMWKLIWNKS